MATVILDDSLISSNCQRFSDQQSKYKIGNFQDLFVHIYQGGGKEGHFGNIIQVNHRSHLVSLF